jgi:two-component system nitrate/nitrite response regulator NarL
METTAIGQGLDHGAVPVDILLVGEQLLFREGLRKLLQDQPGFRVVGEAPDADQASTAIAALKPDVVIVSLWGRLLPRMLRKLEKLTAAGSRTRTILMTTTIEETNIVQAHELGVSGILLKDTTPQMLFDSVRSVAAGECWLDQEPVHDLGQGRHYSSPVHNNRFGLTNREVEILEAVLRTETNRAIASQLSIRQDSVRHHLTNIFTKVGVLSRLQLAEYALAHRLTADGSGMPAASVDVAMQRAS